MSNRITLILGEEGEDPTQSIHGYVPLPVDRGVLQSYQEKIINSNKIIDLWEGNVFKQEITGETELSFINAGKDEAHSFTLIIEMKVESDPVGNFVTFPKTVRWQNKVMPSIEKRNTTYLFTFLTIDGGASWMGVIGGEFE